MEVLPVKALLRAALTAAAVLAIAFAPRAPLAAEPAPQPRPALEDPFTERGVAGSELLLRRGPDALAEVMLVVPAGTLLAVSPEPVRGHLRVRLADATSGWADRAAVRMAADAEAAWTADSPVEAPRVVSPGTVGLPVPLGGRLPRRHDGLLVRVEFGASWLSSDASIARGTGPFPLGATVTGHSVAGAVTVGAAVRENLALGIQAWGATGVGLRNGGWSRDYLGLDHPVLPPDRIARLATAAAGPAVAVYAMPSNVHATAAVGAAWIRPVTHPPYVDYPFQGTAPSQYLGAPYDPGLGLAARLAVGKEWWLRSGDAGVGVSASYAWSWNPDHRWHGDGWRTSVVTFGLSATWN
ncbi:MAG: hypothetical protein U0229_23970 [Anaeromyxobacter sp.]